MNNIVFKNIPNNEQGLTFIRVLRQSLKGTKFRAWPRGRGPRKSVVSVSGRSHDRLRQDLPTKHATHFSVYLVEKPAFVYKRVERNEVDYVRVPTKWATPAQRKQYEVEALQKGVTFGQ